MDRFSDFYQEHVRMVRNLLFRMGLDSELDDAMQDCFIRAWKALKSESSASFAGRSKIRTWLTRITMNTAFDYLRKRRSERILAVAGDTLTASVPSGQVAAENNDIVTKLLRSLKPESRAVLVLNTMEGFSVDEIAELLEIPAGTVKSRLHTARQESEKELKRLGVRL